LLINRPNSLGKTFVPSGLFRKAGGWQLALFRGKIPFITALPKLRTLVREMKAKQGFKLHRKLILKRLKACWKKPRLWRGSL